MPAGRIENYSARRDDGAAGSKEDPDDATWTKVFNLILEKHHPNLALLHLVNIDHTEHATGPQSPEAYAAIKTADDQVRDILNVLKKEYPGKATLFVVSDHGFSPIDHQVLPNVVLKKAGLVETAGDRITGGAVQVVVQGGSGAGLCDGRSRSARNDRASQKGVCRCGGCGKNRGREDLARYGLAQPQRVLTRLTSSSLPKWAGTLAIRRPASCHSSTNQNAREATGTTPSCPNCTRRLWPGATASSRRESGTIENTSIAPTIARLLGLAMPDVEGKPLEAVLAE